MANPERKNFLDEETEMLLTLYEEENIQRRLRGTLKGHKQVWADLAARHSHSGYERNWLQVKDKVCNLKRRYFEIRRSLRSGDSPPEWRFWDPLHRIFGSKPSATPVAGMDSITDTQSGSDTGSCKAVIQEERGSGMAVHEGKEAVSSMADHEGKEAGSSSGSSVSQPMRKKARRRSSLDEELLAFLTESEKKSDERYARLEKRDEMMLAEMAAVSKSFNDFLKASASSLHVSSTSHPVPNPPPQLPVATPISSLTPSLSLSTASSTINLPPQCQQTGGQNLPISMEDLFKLIRSSDSPTISIPSPSNYALPSPSVKVPLSPSTPSYGHLHPDKNPLPQTPVTSKYIRLDDGSIVPVLKILRR
ncbi:uncharacterized protein LOC124166722 [Ischnura elegans]|uniref:uncharacterized protein LOC124166722 n=1 Tax=Ischnura elegans TaxID=197161 RepID=UPI001ED8A104|nr:uncharacterized protein LOC124166722 [Ischnura elegans]